MFTCGTLIVSRRTWNGLLPSIGCLQEPPEDSSLYQEERMSLSETFTPTFDLSNDDLLRNDPISSPLFSYSTDSVESDQSDMHLSDSCSGTSSVSYSEPDGGLNSYLQYLIVKQKQSKAKERRLRRMQILKMRRRNGLISFDVRPLRYESKRRR